MSAPQVIRLADFREFATDRHIAKLMHDSDKCRVVLFCLEAGQDLSPHESTSEVVFYGVEGMRIGGTRRLEIAPHLAYGERGVPGSIPPNAMLIVEITILDGPTR